MGRRQNGTPRWVLPGEEIEDDEDPGGRPCAEQAGLEVVVDKLIGQRRDAVTGEVLVYLACSLTVEMAIRANATGELAEVRWGRSSTWSTL